MSQSPFLFIKQLEADVLRLLSYIDVSDLDTRQQHAVAQLKNGLIDARLEIQDYELAETRDHQLANARQAKEYLQNVQKHITANTMQAFGAVDVAQLTAYIGQVTDRLR